MLKRREAKLGREHPDTLWTVANLGVNYKDAGRLNEAIPLFEEAHRASGRIPALRYVDAPLLDAYVKAGRLTEAVKLVHNNLDDARKTAPRDSPQLAGMLEQFGRTLLEVKAYAEAEPLLRECLSIREKAEPERWSTFEAKSQLGGALLSQKKYAEAEPPLVAGYEGMKRLKATIPPRSNNRLIEDLERLVQLYRKAIELDPEYAHAHNGLGNALRDKGRVDEAIALYRKAIELDPKLVNAHNGLGDALRDKGGVDAAIAEYRKAIELDPKLVNAHNGLGDALRDKGGVDAAIAEYRKAIELDPKSAVAHFDLGMALKARGDLDEAERAFREAVRLDGEHHLAAIDALAELLRSRGNWKEAIATYQKIVLLDSNSASAHCHLGMALKASGNLDGAIAAFEEGVRRQPDFPEAHFGLASALANATQWDRSARVYAAALKRFGARLWPGRWSEAIRSNEVFTRLTAQQEDDRLPRIMRARLDVYQRDWKRAAVDYARLNESLASVDPADLLPDADDLFGYGCVLALLGDHNGHEQFCKKWADRVGDSPAWGYCLARAWAVSPRPVVPAQQIVERVEKAVAAGRSPWSLHVLSLAHYRNGEFEKAVECALESNEGFWRGSAKALNWVVQAMAHARLGHAADARQSLQQALNMAGRADPGQIPGVDWPSMQAQDFAEFELLRREAEELINPKSLEKPDKKSG
jgi:tetratricopeptide (TPR) repeat protein